MVSGVRLSSGISVLLIATVALTIPTTADDHWGEDREATYVGATGVDHEINEECEELVGDCFGVVPRDLGSAKCDDSEGFDGTGIHGVGGIIFCGVEIGASVNVTIHDAFHSSARGAVRCSAAAHVIPIDTGPVGSSSTVTIVHHNKTLGTADPSVRFTVSESCLDLSDFYRDYPPGHTDLWVPLYAGFATAGTVTLKHESTG